MKTLLSNLESAKNSLTIKSPIGEVFINVNTFEFTYIGKFGNMILKQCINNNCLNDVTKKLIILNTHIELCNSKIGKVNMVID